MMGNARNQRRLGAVLFEVLLSIALFVGAAAFAMGTSRAMIGNLDRAHREQQAVDVARSKMAELRAGLISIADLQGERIVGVGSLDHFNEQQAGEQQWTIEIDTSRTEHPGLNLVELTVTELSTRPDAASYTLRQLVRLRDVDDDEMYQHDELLEGL